jgi:16S rRNA processing protein RimM
VEELSDPVVVGVVGAPHGIRGTVRVKATGSGRHLREGSEPVVGGRRRRIAKVRETPKGFLVDFEGVEAREAAVGLQSLELKLDRGELDPTDEEEFYVDDLVGLLAVDEEGEELGAVREVSETPIYELLHIRPEGVTPEEVLVPFTREHVPEVNVEDRRVVVRPPGR